MTYATWHKSVQIVIQLPWDDLTRYRTRLSDLVTRLGSNL